MTTLPVDISEMPKRPGLIDTVIAGGYCVGCGACAALPQSPFKVEMTSAGQYVAALVDKDASLETAAAVCPFFDHGLNEGALVPTSLQHGAEYHADIGWYRMLFAGYANDNDFRESGSSGGLTNWLAAELLSTGMVDGVIHVKPAESATPGGLLFEYSLSNDVSGLKSGAKSKYYPIEISRVMTLVRNMPGRYAFIGVPCFIKAVRLLARSDDAIRQSIKYCIALFCGHLKSRAFAEHAAWQLGIEPSNLTQFDFRTKVADKPANRYAVTAQGIQDGQHIVVSRPTEELQGSDWGMGFFKLKACDYCDDIVGETADVSIGDAWLPDYVSDSRGTNIVVVRNPELAEIFEQSSRRGRIHVKPVSVEEVHKSQDSNYRHRRDGLAYRLAVADENEIWHPMKRVEPCSSEISPARQAVLDLRTQLSEYSHTFFESAKKSGRLGLFADLIAPLQGEYKKALESERRQQKPGVVSSVPHSKLLKASLRGMVRYYFRRLQTEIFRIKRLAIPTRNSALILPPTTAGSVGDDALVSSTLKTLRKKGFKKIGLLSHDLNCPFKFTEQPDEIIGISGYMSYRNNKSSFDILKSATGYDYLFVLGADVLDGYYSDTGSNKRLMLADCASRLGMKTALLGFSYNESPAKLSLRGLKQLPKDVKICARDPVSYARLKKRMSTAPIQTADVAFLLDPEKPHDPDFLAWLEQTQASSSPIYGINAIFTSKFFTDKSVQSQTNYLNFYQNLIKALLERHPNARFVFIPHDYRPDGIGEGPVLEHLYYSLPTSIQSQIYLLTKHYSAAEIKWLAGQLDFIVSSRMHLAIAAIGQGIPVFCFEYQGKFQGLFELIGMPELLSSMEAALADPQTLIESVLQHIDRGATIQERMQQKIPELLALAEKNFDFSAKT